MNSNDHIFAPLLEILLRSPIHDIHAIPTPAGILTESSHFANALRHSTLLFLPQTLMRIYHLWLSSGSARICRANKAYLCSRSLVESVPTLIGTIILQDAFARRSFVAQDKCTGATSSSTECAKSRPRKVVRTQPF